MRVKPEAAACAANQEAMPGAVGVILWRSVVEPAVESPVSETDRADIAAALDGDERAYACLIARHQPLVYRHMGRFTRDPAQLDELVQDVFVQVYYSLSRFRGEAPFEHWLRKLATRAGYRHWQRKASERQRSEQLDGWVRSLPPPERQTPTEAADTLYELLALLPPKDRLVLTLYYMEECSANEVAERMGWNATLVRVRAHRALAALRKRLAEQYPGGMDHA